MPDVLVQIVAVAGVDARREKGQKQRSMPAVEPFERISGRAKSPLRRIAAGNRGGQLLIAPGRLVHDGCHELRVCETRARQSRGNLFRPSVSTVDNHGRAQRTDGNDPSKCVLVDHNHDVSFSWKTAVTIRPHSHWRTNHTAISSRKSRDLITTARGCFWQNEPSATALVPSRREQIPEAIAKLGQSCRKLSKVGTVREVFDQDGSSFSLCSLGPSWFIAFPCKRIGV